MKELIINNSELFISFISMIVTFLVGFFSKKCKHIKNNIIPLENTLIALVAVALYYYATGSFSAVVASGSPVATLLYDLVHNINKNKEEDE